MAPSPLRSARSKNWADGLPDPGPPALDPLLHRAQADLDPVLALQLLANDVGIPAVPEEPLAQPILQTVERPPALGLAERHRAPGAKAAPTVFRAQPNSIDSRLDPQPSSCNRTIAVTSSD